MSKHNRQGARQVDVKCPFYRGYTTTDVRCEGLMDRTGIILTFGDVQDHRRHMDVFCCDHYDYCEIYRLVKDTRYPDD